MALIGERACRPGGAVIDSGRGDAAVAAERDRIAALLNDQIVRELFSMGLLLERLASQQPDLGAELTALVDQSDDIIRRIRELIFTGFESSAAEDASAG